MRENEECEWSLKLKLPPYFKSWKVKQVNWCLIEVFWYSLTNHLQKNLIFHSLLLFKCNVSLIKNNYFKFLGDCVKPYWEMWSWRGQKLQHTTAAPLLSPRPFNMRWSILYAQVSELVLKHQPVPSFSSWKYPVYIKYSLQARMLNKRSRKHSESQRVLKELKYR